MTLERWHKYGVKKAVNQFALNITSAMGRMLERLSAEKLDLCSLKTRKYIRDEITKRLLWTLSTPLNALDVKRGVRGMLRNRYRVDHKLLEAIEQHGVLDGVLGYFCGHFNNKKVAAENANLRHIRQELEQRVQELEWKLEQKSIVPVKPRRRLARKP